MINYSIIIPHYNIPELLVRCLRSIPIRADIQVIVVDDLSPNGEKYVEKYPDLSRPYLEYYRTSKGGSAGRARNLGLKHAKGRWLIFADADDFFPPEFEKILDEYLNNESDIIYFNVMGVMSEDVSVHVDRNNRNPFFEMVKKNNDSLCFRVECVTPWGKMIKRSLINILHAKFDETRHSNDYYFSVATGIGANKVLPVDEVFYVVTSRPGSLSSVSMYDSKNLSLREAKDRFWVAMKVQNFLNKKNISYPVEKYKYYAMFYLRSHKYSFVFSFISAIFVYPRLCVMIFLYWLKNKK